MLYQCARCKENLPETYFSKAPRNTYRHGLQSYCRKCMLEYGKRHRKDNAEQYRQNARNRYSDSLETRLRSLLRASTADRSLLDFEWCWNRLKENEFRCEITKAPLSYEKRHPCSLSIDRIDPTKGYTKDNTRFVCWWINAAMGNWGLDKLKQLIKEWDID